MLDFNISILNIGRPNLQCLTVDKLSTYLLSKYPLNKLIYLSLSGIWRGCFVYNEALRLSANTLITYLLPPPLIDCISSSSSTLKGGVVPILQTQEPSTSFLNFILFLKIILKNWFLKKCLLNKPKGPICVDYFLF